ncbi:MAG: trans-aconitate 2-methyltransferase, partial [Bradymonadaceae bacterium]
MTAFEERFLEGFAARVPHGGSTVDLGCGIGVPFDRWLVDAGFELTGIDVASSHVREARRRVPEAEFVEADFSEWTPYTIFDGALSLYTIFHLPADEHRDVQQHVGRRRTVSVRVGEPHRIRRIDVDAEPVIFREESIKGTVEVEVLGLLALI